jgi:hypothetical protein
MIVPPTTIVKSLLLRENVEWEVRTRDKKRMKPSPMTILILRYKNKELSLLLLS